MANDYFAFKQFTVGQTRSAMRVGTDGVLLGAWFDIGNPPPARILDVGTGTGLIALMAAQRSTRSRIDALEINALSSLDATANFTASPWSDRLSLFETDFVKFADHTLHRYDRILSNPPYFVDSLKCPEQARNQARHADSLSHEGLLRGSCKLLTNQGLLSVILPAERIESFTNLALSHALFPMRTCLVSSLEGAPAKRVLIEFSPQPQPHEITALAIETKQERGYTPEYTALTKEFYLKM